MSWGDLEVEKPKKDVLAAAAKAKTTTPTPSPAAKKPKPVKAKQAVKDKPATGYLTEAENELFDSLLDGRSRAATIRKLIIQWMKGND